MIVSPIKWSPIVLLPIIKVEIRRSFPLTRCDPDRFQFPRLFPDSRNSATTYCSVIRETMSLPLLDGRPCTRARYRVRVISSGWRGSPWLTTPSGIPQLRGTMKALRYVAARKIKLVNVGREQHCPFSSGRITSLSRDAIRNCKPRNNPRASLSPDC